MYIATRLSWGRPGGQEHNLISNHSNFRLQGHEQSSSGSCSSASMCVCVQCCITALLQPLKNLSEVEVCQFTLSSTETAA